MTGGINARRRLPPLFGYPRPAISVSIRFVRYIAMTTRQRPFSYSWGSGYVAEEARVRGEHHEPALQLLKYTDGDAAGRVSIRFCHYSHDGHFRRSPLLMSPDEMDLIRLALNEAPELRDLLRRMVEE